MQGARLVAVEDALAREPDARLEAPAVGRALGGRDERRGPRVLPVALQDAEQDRAQPRRRERPDALHDVHDLAIGPDEEERRLDDLQEQWIVRVPVPGAEAPADLLVDVEAQRHETPPDQRREFGIVEQREPHVVVDDRRAIHVAALDARCIDEHEALRGLRALQRAVEQETAVERRRPRLVHAPAVLAAQVVAPVGIRDPRHEVAGRPHEGGQIGRGRRRRGRFERGRCSRLLDRRGEQPAEERRNEEKRHTRAPDAEWTGRSPKRNGF